MYVAFIVEWVTADKEIDVFIPKAASVGRAGRRKLVPYLH